MDEPHNTLNDPESPPERFADLPAAPEPPVEPADSESLDLEEEEEEASSAGRGWGVTIMVGLAALALGLLLGYVGRGQFGPEAQAAKATQTVQAGMAATQAAGNQKLMDYLIGQSRHAKGPQDAQVTIIEFSDYQ